MDISNKFLVFLLVIAIVISLIGTLYSIDKLSKIGFISASDVFGYVNITISNQTTINVTATNCDFGTGYVTPPASYAILAPGIYIPIPDPPSCEGGDTLDNWTNTTVYDPSCMKIRNDGNINLTINVSSGKNTDEFIGGNSATNEYKVWSEDNVEDGACISGWVPFQGTEMTKSNITICDKLLPDNATDEIYVGCYLQIPDNAYGVKTDTWTFWASPAA